MSHDTHHLDAAVMPERRRRILVTFGSTRGGTAEIAARIADVLREVGSNVDCLAAAAVTSIATYDAVILGGALYMGRWVREARRFVARHASELRQRPVWLFSSGPLDASADRAPIPPTRSVAAIMARVGARGHATFGGRLAPDARGFLAAAMAKTRAGDWRNWEDIRRWTAEIAAALATAPRAVPAASRPRPPRVVLGLLGLAVGVTAIYGGLALTARPDGSLLHMPLALLQPTPFRSFLVPGLLLLLVIGVGNLLAGILVIRRAPGASTAAFAGGAALLTWILTEMILLRSVHWLQLTYLVVAIAILVEAARQRRAVDRPAATPRSQLTA